MLKFRIILFFCLAYFFSPSLLFAQNTNKAQQKKIDSLLVLIKRAKEDTNKANLLNEISKYYRSNLKELKNVADELSALGQKIKDNKTEFNANSLYFSYYRNMNMYEKCLDYAKKNLNLAQKTKDASQEANAYNSLGVVYGSGLKRYDKAIVYYKRSLNIRLANNLKGLETLYNNIANAYNQMNKHLDSALYYIDKAIEIGNQSKSNERFRNIGVYYSTKGEIYTTLKDWEKAVSFLRQSLMMKEKMHDLSTHTYIYNYLGHIYEEKKNLDSAWRMYQASIEVFTRTKVKSDILKTYDGLARIAEKRGQFEDALRYYKLRADGQDASQKETMDKLHLLETEQQAREIAILAKEKKLQDERIRQGNIVMVLTIVGLVILMGFLVWIYRQNKIQQKISQQLTQTNLEVQEKSQEMLAMNEELNSTVEELNLTIETVDQQKQLIELANQRMHDSIKYGKKIQEAILPTEQEMKSAFQDYFAIYMPRDTVSGDFYWYYKLDDTTQYIAAVDCTGHGVPGAFMSMIGYSLLNQILSEMHITLPSEILHYLDLGIMQGLRQSNTQNVDGMDVCLCKIDKLSEDEVMVDYAGAKRPLFYSDNEIIQLIRPTRESIGGFTAGAEERQFPSQQIKLYKGDVLYLTTDGFTDNPNKHRKRFGEERFAKLLQAIVPRDMKDQHELLISAYQVHQEGTAQRDDIAIVGVRL